MGTRGYLAGLMGMHYPTEYTDNRIKSVAPEKWNLFHEMLLMDELSRAGFGGFVWNVRDRMSASGEIREEGVG